ncbi:MAG: histidinol-phosphate transaminase [Leptolyngbyaceae cyanobacterium]
MPAFIRPELQRFSAYGAHASTEELSLPKSVDQLDTNESSYDLPGELKDKLAWEYQNTIKANRYPDGGHFDLRAAIAAYANESADLHPAAITADHVTVGNGSDELIRSLLIATCVGRTGAILVAEPTFSMYRILAQTLGVEVIAVERDPQTFAIQVAAAQSAISNAATPVRMIFMVSPNSPTGNSLTTAELNWMRNLSTDILVVVDEAYFEFCQQTVLADALSRPNWLVTRTFSKAFRLAAHRVGYAISTPETIAVLEKVRLPYNLPSFSQFAALSALKQAPALLAKVAEVQHERDLMMSALAKLPNLQIWPSDANFIYGRPTDHGADKIAQQLYQLGSKIRHTGGGLRITVGTPAENQRTISHLKQVLL